MGLPKHAIERNCPKISDKTAEQNKGGHTVQELVKIVKDDRFEKMVSFIEDYLRTKYLPSMSKALWKQSLEDLLNFKKLEPHEIEAVRRVYRELYGELPKED